MLSEIISGWEFQTRRRFFVDGIEEGIARLTGAEAHHLARVLRAETGRQYEITDGQSLYLAEITGAGKNTVTFRVLQPLDPGPPLPPVTLFASLIKFDRFEWLVEKATELGVERLVPVETERTGRGLLQAAAKRVERWRRIARESSQQSRRVRAPQIGDPTVLSAVDFHGACVRLEEQGESPGLLKTLKNISGASYGILVGPEGGWTDRERASLDRDGWQPVSLGPLVLRTETAAMAALVLFHEWWLTRIH